MLQGFEDGVYMDNSVCIVDEKKQGIPLVIRIAQLLFILIGTWSGISMLSEALNVPCNHIYINLAVLIFTGIFYGLFLLPAYDLVKVFFGVLFYGLFLYSRGARLMNGFYILENLTLRQIDAYYEVESVRFVADYTTQVEDTTLLMIMILIHVTAILALAVMRNRLPALAGLLLLIPAAANFALGLVPSERYLVAYVIFMTYLISQSHRNRDAADMRQRRLFHKINSRAAMWLSFLGLLLFFLMKLFVSEEKYDSMTKLEETKTDMQTAILDFSMEDFLDRITTVQLFTRKVSSSGLDGGRLGTAAQVRYENVEQLRVTAPTSSIEEGIYLKGYVGSIYEGDRWTEHTEETRNEYEALTAKMPEDKFQPVNQVNLFLRDMFSQSPADTTKTGELQYSMKEGSMEIRYKQANKHFLYAPYFTNYDRLKDIYYNRDLYAAPEASGDRYLFDYYYKVARAKDVGLQESLSALGAKGYADYEKAYREFVYKAYTMLPEEGLKNIKRDFSAERVQTRTGSVAEKIEYVRKYLEDNTRYSLSPGKLPKDKDFVEYFLYENKVGYCAHYASAATLMLRAMGIPARYVEGYAFGKEAIYESSGVGDVTRYAAEGSKVNKEAFSEVSVRDYHAHAWVEVYFDYCGWYPVEFTPGSLVSYNQSVIADIDRMGNEISEAELLKDLDKDTEETKLPEQYQPIMDERINKDYDSNGNTDGTPHSSEADLFFFTITFLVLAVTVVLLLGFLFLRGYRNRNQGGRNKRAFTFYRDIEKMLTAVKGLPGKKMLLEEQEAYVKEHCSYITSEELDRLMGLVRRARFGRTAVSEEELSEILRYRNSLYYKVSSDLSAMKKLKLKFLLAI